MFEEPVGFKAEVSYVNHALLYFLVKKVRRFMFERDGA